MELAGHECIGHCENDKYAEKSYRAMHKIKRRVNGLEKISQKLEQKSYQEQMCGVWDSHARTYQSEEVKLDSMGIVQVCFSQLQDLLGIKNKDRPKYLFIENVRNLFSVNQGFDFLKLQIELAKSAMIW